MEHSLTLTKDAVHKVKELQHKEGAEGQGLRVGVKQGGCAGMSYALFFDHEGDGDVVQEQDGVKILVSKDHIGMLEGIQLDYVDGLQGAGFKFMNPKAKGGCGCGNSFSV